MFITNSAQVTRPFTLCCESCDAGLDQLSPEAAVEAGWVEITEAFDAANCNYLGICPDCQERPAEPDSPK